MPLGPLGRVLPGALLCSAVAGAGWVLAAIEDMVFRRPYLEALVLAILLGVVVRTVWSPGERWTRGIAFSAKTLLEIAVALLGASISGQALASAGTGLVVGIAAVVTGSIVASYAVSRALGLTHRMAMLVACGNSICGNSAIAAVAPVIGADGEDVASSIAYTAILGVVVVLGLPLLAPALGLSGAQYGVLAGLTVYAVPQVLAATIPVGALSAQLGTLVKLVRVLMLGPVVLALSLSSSCDDRRRRKPLSLQRFAPWFIIGFLLLAVLRTLGLVPAPARDATLQLANVLTVISMAGLGLGVDVRVLGRVGARVTLAVSASLLVLLAISLCLIQLLAIT